nr:hypothetical protein [Tanacetum cinerariifolium]
MADVNAPSGQTLTMAPPVRADDQILPHIRWVPIGKSNCYLDLEKSQSNPIYKIADTILYDKKAGCYKYQLDEQWFDLTKETLREALQITPFNHNQAFAAPLSIDGLINFVNQLGYPKEKRATLIVIPSIRFTKLIIHHLQRKNKFHPRPDSPHHLSNEEPVLGYLKFSAKGTKSEVFKMPIPDSLITAEIQQATYYREYLAKATETTDKLAKAKRIKHSISRKTRQPRSSPKSVGVSEAKKVPAEEPQVADEDADYQKAMEESMKDAYALPKGPLPPVVIREPESRKYQPLLEALGKGKAKVTKERVFEPTGSSRHDESPYALVGQSDNEEESEKVMLGAEEGGQDEGQEGPDPDAQAEDQTRSDADHEHMDLDVADVLPQPSTEQLDKGFTAMVYPNVQENLKLVVEELVLLEEPASSSGTLSSLQHLKTKVESMVNVMIQQALSSISLMTSPIIDLTSRHESPKEHQQLKATTTDTTTTTTTLPPPQAPQQSMTEAMMVKHIGELEHILADMIQVNKNIEERLDKHGARLYTLEQLDIPQQMSIDVSEVVTNAVDWAMQAPQRNHFRDLPKADMKEILHQRIWESDSYKSHEDHMQLFEALEKSMNRDYSEELAQDLAEARKKKKKSRESPKTPPGSPSHQPPPPPPPAGPSRASRAPRASGSTQMPPSPPPTSSTNQESPSKGSVAPTVNLRQGWWKHFEEERPTTLEPAWSIRSSDVPVLTNNWAAALASNYSPPLEDSLLAQTGDIAIFIDWFCKRRGITELKPQDLDGPAYEIVKVFHPDVIHLQYQMEECHKLPTDSVDDPILRHNVSKPLPLGGPSGQVTIQSDFFFNKDLEYLRYGSKGRSHALSILKMKTAYYPDAGLEQMVPDQFWIEEECKYDIAAIAVRIHMRILSVVRIKVFSMYGYDYMKKIVLHHADLNEHVIAERDFKYLYPSDFEDLYLLNLQGHLNHLLPKDKKILTTTVNQWTRQLVIQQRVEDFQHGIESYQTQIMMRFNEIHKFSDGTLLQIDEALDYRVKEFRINRLNSGLNTRFWTRKDVDRCNAFMFAIQRRLRTRRIFRNLERFVGGHEKSENKGRVPTEMELELEHTQQGSSCEVSVIHKLTDNQRAINFVRARENVGTQDLVECRTSRLGDDTNDEPEDQELEAHYMFMEKIQEVTPDDADNSGPIFDDEPLQKVHNSDADYNVFANERQHPKQPESVNDTYLIEQAHINTHTPPLILFSAPPPNIQPPPTIFLTICLQPQPLLLPIISSSLHAITTFISSPPRCSYRDHLPPRQPPLHHSHPYQRYTSSSPLHTTTTAADTTTLYPSSTHHHPHIRHHHRSTTTTQSPTSIAGSHYTTLVRLFM